MASKESEMRVLVIWIVGSHPSALFLAWQNSGKRLRRSTKVQKAKSAAIVERLARVTARSPFRDFDAVHASSNEYRIVHLSPIRRIPEERALLRDR